MNRNDFEVELGGVIRSLTPHDQEKATAPVREALWERYGRESLRIWRNACLLIKLEARWPSRATWEKAVSDSRRDLEANARASADKGRAKPPCDCGGELDEIRRFLAPSRPVPVAIAQKGPEAISLWNAEHNVLTLSALMRCTKCARFFARALQDGEHVRRDGSRVQVTAGLTIPLEWPQVAPIMGESDLPTREDALADFKGDEEKYREYHAARLQVLKASLRSGGRGQLANDLLDLADRFPEKATTLTRDAGMVMAGIEDAPDRSVEPAGDDSGVEPIPEATPIENSGLRPESDLNNEGW